MALLEVRVVPGERINKIATLTTRYKPHDLPLVLLGRQVQLCQCLLLVPVCETIRNDLGMHTQTYCTCGPLAPSGPGFP